MQIGKVRFLVLILILLSSIETVSATTYNVTASNTVKYQNNSANSGDQFATYILLTLPTPTENIVGTARFNWSQKSGGGFGSWAAVYVNGVSQMSFYYIGSSTYTPVTVDISNIQVNTTDTVTLRGYGNPGDTIWVSGFWENYSYSTPAPANIAATTGLFWVNTTWQPSSSVPSTNTYNVSVNGTWTNGTTQNWTNSTANSGTWINVTVYSYNNTYGSSVGATLNTQTPVQYLPPTPTNLQSTTGNFWVNNTWSAGSGNVTDLYNVSINGTWYNGSAATFKNTTGMAPHGWDNASVYAYNNSNGGTLNTISATNNTQIPNNPVTISNISSTYNLNISGTLFINPTSTDIDSDTPTFSTTATKGVFYTNNGTLKWTTQAGDSGVYTWFINVTDGYGSTASKSLVVSVNSTTPGAPLNIASTTGNFWVNTTWSASVNTNTFNVSVNGTWTNGSAATFMNSTVSPHGWANVTVLGYNTTSSVVGNSSSQNTQVPDNLPVYGSTSISSATIYTTGSTTIEIDNVTDADNDSINITVGVTLTGGSEVNNTMVQTAGTSTWTYPFSTLTTGTYTVTHFYISTAYGNVTKSDTLQFTVTTAPSASSGGGGGGGGGSSTTTTIIQQVNATSPPLLAQNLTEGSEPATDAIAKCLTESLTMSNRCNGYNFGVVVEPFNWWVAIGAIISGFAVVGAKELYAPKKRDWLPDSLLYGAVTIILVVAGTEVGINMYFINYIVDSPKYAWTFFSFMTWGAMVSLIGDAYTYRNLNKNKKKVYILKTDTVFPFKSQ